MANPGYNGGVTWPLRGWASLPSSLGRSWVFPALPGHSSPARLLFVVGQLMTAGFGAPLLHWPSASSPLVMWSPSLVIGDLASFSLRLLCLPHGIPSLCPFTQCGLGLTSAAGCLPHGNPGLCPFTHCGLGTLTMGQLFTLERGLELTRPSPKRFTTEPSRAFSNLRFRFRSINISFRLALVSAAFWVSTWVRSSSREVTERRRGFERLQLHVLIWWWWVLFTTLTAPFWLLSCFPPLHLS